MYVQEIDLPIQGIHCIVDLWIDDYCKPRFLFGRSLSSTRYADYLLLLLLCRSVGVFWLANQPAIHWTELITLRRTIDDDDDGRKEGVVGGTC